MPRDFGRSWQPVMLQPQFDHQQPGALFRPRSSTIISQWRPDWPEVQQVCSLRRLAADDDLLRTQLLTTITLGAARLRPSLIPRTTLPALTSLTSTRDASNVPTTDPKTKAQSLIDALPGSSLISKTAILSSAAGLSIYAISNEYYVLNEESVVAFALLTMWISVFRYGGPMYSQWAEGQNEKMKGILNAARADHTQAVKNRIENVQQMSSVVDVTKSLFDVSKVCGLREGVVIDGLCWDANDFVGDRPDRGSGLRARAEDGPGTRG
jgi:hypothetical protein